MELWEGWRRSRRRPLNGMSIKWVYGRMEEVEEVEY